MDETPQIFISLYIKLSQEIIQVKITMHDALFHDKHVLSR